MRNYLFILILLITSLHQSINAQVLHTESFSVILDSSRNVQGSFMPSFRYRNVQKEFIEIENTADITIHFNNHALTFANKLEYAIYGKENLMSGGFVFLEYRNIRHNTRFTIEPFFQLHWQGIRGLESKYAGGANLRWRVLVKPDLGVFAGFGVLYEYERWNYSGVADPSSLLLNANPVAINQFRGVSYLSLKRNFGDMFDFDLSVYYQPSLGGQVISHRFASSSALTYNISEHFGLTMVYQNVYDTKPVVPIEKLYNDINLGVTISF